MPKISGQIHIAASVEEVFDTVADTRNEPTYNASMRDVELLTPPPIGLGTRFRAPMGKSATPMQVEITEFERPHRLGSRTTSSLMETSGTMTFSVHGDGMLMSWDWQVRPKGWLRALGPAFGTLGGRMERTIWTGLKHHLEQGGTFRST